ncbi:MAG: MBL fold metallo-hydrolase [Bacillota bacterium]|nr:MBL fold metallo-hydrolase [Bacillota bacterium]
MLENITKIIKLLPGLNKGRFPYSNSLVIADEEWGIIDTCPGEKPISLVPKEKISKVINTHFHIDHVAFNYLFDQSTFYIHHLDAGAFQGPEAFKGLTGFNILRDTGPHLEQRIGRYPFGLEGVVELKDGDMIEVGKTRITTIHTPGHCAGHCSFYVEEEDVLFSGDIDLSSFGPWYGNYASDIDQFIASVHKLIEIKPGCLVTSHAPVARENIRKRLLEYIGIIDARDEKILQILRTPGSLEDIVAEKPIFKRYPNSDKLHSFFEGKMVAKHLQRLLRDGRIQQLEENIYVACSRRCQAGK